jgi:hypothetical protein
MSIGLGDLVMMRTDNESCYWAADGSMDCWKGKLVIIEDAFQTRNTTVYRVLGDTQGCIFTADMFQPRSASEPTSPADAASVYAEAMQILNRHPGSLPAPDEIRITRESWRLITAELYRGHQLCCFSSIQLDNMSSGDFFLGAKLALESFAQAYGASAMDFKPGQQVYFDDTVQCRKLRGQAAVITDIRQELLEVCLEDSSGTKKYYVAHCHHAHPAPCSATFPH